MPGLAAAGFKPAVYTNFTTLAHRRMILEDCTELEAMAVSRLMACSKPGKKEQARHSNSFKSTLAVHPHYD